MLTRLEVDGFGKSIPDQVATALALYSDCRVVFVHRDSDAPDPTERRETLGPLPPVTVLESLASPKERLEKLVIEAQTLRSARRRLSFSAVRRRLLEELDLQAEPLQGLFAVARLRRDVDKVYKALFP